MQIDFQAISVASLDVIERSKNQSPFDSFVPLLGAGVHRVFGWLAQTGWKCVVIVFVSELASPNSIALLELNLRNFLSQLHGSIVDALSNPFFGLTFEESILSDASSSSDFPFDSSASIAKVIAGHAPLDLTERMPNR